MRLAGTIVLSSACLLGWLTPEHFLPWVSWHSEVPVFAAAFLLACAGTLNRLRAGGWAAWIEIPRASLMFVGLAAIAVLQVFAGLITFAGDALIVCLYMALSAASLALGYATGRAESQVPAGETDRWSRAEFMAAVLLVGATTSAILALAQTFEVWEQASWVYRMEAARRPGANLAQPNHLATLLAMGVASLVYLYEGKRLSGSLAVQLFVVLSVGLAATESRSGAVSLLLLMCWWLAGRQRLQFRLQVRTAASAMAGLLILFGCWPRFMAGMNIFETGARVSTSSGMRTTVWPQLLEAVSVRPWLGWGLREVSTAHNAVAHAYATSLPLTYAHNIGLDLLLGLGIPLALVFIWLAASWARRRTGAFSTLLQWYCAAALLPLAVHSMLEFPFAYAYFLAPAFFLLGMFEATVRRRPLRLPATAAAMIAVTATVLGGWTAVEYVQVEEDFRIARFEAIHVGQPPPGYERPHILLLTQLDALLSAARIVPRPAMSEQAIELARTAALRFPWPATQNRYALSLALNGNAVEAARQLKVIHALHGDVAYAKIRSQWEQMAQETYPQLRGLASQ